MSLFDDMLVFVRVTEAGSFSAAALRLNIAKSVVSRRVHSLESRLGTNLFYRTTRRLSLTETGTAYYDRVKRILADVTEADDVARQLQGELRGKLKIAAPMSFGWRHLSPAIAEFLAMHPGLDLEVELNDRRVDLVAEGYDLAIRIGKLPDSSLISRVLAPCRHVVCGSPAYFSRRDVPATPDELSSQGHDCLVYSNRSTAEQWRFRVGKDWKEIPILAPRLGANNGEMLLAAVIAGVGLVVLPSFILSEAILSGSLRVILENYEFFDESIHAVWPPNRQLSAKVRAFVDFLAERFGSVPYWDRPFSSL